MNPAYVTEQPTREQIEARRGPLVLEFVTNWCGHGQVAQPAVAEALAHYGQVERLNVEDGKGRPLGRSFGVKLWPTLIFLKDGVEVTRVVRPTQAEPVRTALKAIDGSISHG